MDRDDIFFITNIEHPKNTKKITYYYEMYDPHVEGLIREPQETDYVLTLDEKGNQSFPLFEIPDTETEFIEKIEVYKSVNQIALMQENDTDRVNFISQLRIFVAKYLESQPEKLKNIISVWFRHNNINEM